VLGEVLFLVTVRGAVPSFVNSSLAQFTATARRSSTATPTTR
jgi:hypothetical protein